MKSFIRDNPTIAFGLGLPLLLVVVFLLISGIPTLLVAPPQYDVLYTTGYYNYGGGFQISVVNQKVQVVYQGAMQNYQPLRLWRYSPKTGAVREISMALPPGLKPPGQQPTTTEDTGKITPIDVPDLASLTVDSANIAPDGYEFVARNDGYGGDIFTGLFGGYRYRNATVITKSGRSIALPNTDGRDYYGNFAHFIGWIITP